MFLCNVHKDLASALCKVLNFGKNKFRHFAQKFGQKFVQIAQQRKHGAPGPWARRRILNIFTKKNEDLFNPHLQ